MWGKCGGFWCREVVVFGGKQGKPSDPIAVPQQLLGRLQPEQEPKIAPFNLVAASKN